MKLSCFFFISGSVPEDIVEDIKGKIVCFVKLVYEIVQQSVIITSVQYFTYRSLFLFSAIFITSWMNLCCSSSLKAKPKAGVEFLFHFYFGVAELQLLDIFGRWAQKEDCIVVQSCLEINWKGSVCFEVNFSKKKSIYKRYFGVLRQARGDKNCVYYTEKTESLSRTWMNSYVIVTCATDGKRCFPRKQ